MRTTAAAYFALVPLFWLILLGGIAFAQSEEARLEAPQVQEEALLKAEDQEAAALDKELAKHGYSKEMVEKLSADQLFALLEQREENQSPDSVAVHMVPITIVTVVFMAIFGIVAAGLYLGYRISRHRHETLRAMVDKGVEIPPELITPPAKPRSDLRRGVVLVATGVGMSGFFVVMSGTTDQPGLWSLGLIPALIGLGYLIVWRLEGKKNGEASNGLQEGPERRAFP